jgi:hypothetical protein
MGSRNAAISSKSGQSVGKSVEIPEHVAKAFAGEVRTKYLHGRPTWLKEAEQYIRFGRDHNPPYAWTAIARAIAKAGICEVGPGPVKHAASRYLGLE